MVEVRVGGASRARSDRLKVLKTKFRPIRDIAANVKVRW